MNQRQFEISNIPKNLSELSRFQRWLNLGQLIDEAMLLGLIEYHIRVDKVEIIQSKLFFSNQNNQSMQMINSFLNNSKNKQRRFQSFIEEVKSQNKYDYYFKDVMKAYYKYNFKINPQDQFQFLGQEFKVQFEIFEYNESKIYGIENNGTNNKIILYKYDNYYYLVLKQKENECTNCNTILNLITLQCQHQICNNCIIKQFEQQLNVQTFKCFYPQCQHYVNRYLYLNIKKQQEKNNCNQNTNKLQQKQEGIFRIYNDVYEINEEEFGILFIQCERCGKQEIKKQIIQTPCKHYYCKSCALNQGEIRRKFDCQECANYLQEDHIQQQIQQIKENPENKCCKCKQYFTKTLLFQNYCFHYLCASCLKALAQQQTQLNCPKCRDVININRADQFFDKILTLQIEQTQQVQQKVEQNQQNVQEKFLNQVDRQILPQKVEQEFEPSLFNVKQFMNLMELQCAICGFNYKSLEKKVQLKCQHIFHLHCIEGQKKLKKGRVDCIVCQNIF